MSHGLDIWRQWSGAHPDGRPVVSTALRSGPCIRINATPRNGISRNLPLPARIAEIRGISRTYPAPCRSRRSLSGTSQSVTRLPSSASCKEWRRARKARASPPAPVAAWYGTVRPARHFPFAPPCPQVVQPARQLGHYLLGYRPRDSATVAALINTRGLAELIALNVGLTDGLIGQRLFTVLVLMALITMLMTGPLLSLVCRSPCTPEPMVADELTGRSPRA